VKLVGVAQGLPNRLRDRRDAGRRGGECVLWVGLE
jgi:hypothetical protein